MRIRKRLAALAIAGALLGGTAWAGPSADGAIAGLPYVAQEDPAKQRWNDVRQSGERACRQAVDSAAMLGEQLDVLTRQFSRTLVQVSGDLTRGLAQGMDVLAGRLHEMAERMDRPAD